MKIHTSMQKAGLLFLLVFMIASIALPCYAQFEDAPPQAELPQNPLPSDAYYDKNLIQLRDEWDEEPDPGGSEEGGNEWVGAPIGDGLIAISIALGAYLLFIVQRKRKQEKQSA